MARKESTSPTVNISPVTLLLCWKMSNDWDRRDLNNVGVVVKILFLANRASRGVEKNNGIYEVYGHSSSVAHFNTCIEDLSEIWEVVQEKQNIRRKSNGRK